MLKLIGLIIFTVSFQVSHAATDEAVVIEVRKKIKLHDTERVYADYFIKGGTKLGLSKGVIVSVLRRVPVHDPFDNASVGDFHVKVADMEIIMVDANKAIGRLVEIDRREARPMLTYDAIMIGDRLDLQSMRAKVAYRKAPSDVFEGSRMPASQDTALPQGEPAQNTPENQENNTPALTNP